MGKRKRNIAVYDSYTVCVREGAGTEGEGERERELVHSHEKEITCV